MRALLRTVTWSSFVMLAAASCASVIGIEDAEPDPLLAAPPERLDCVEYCDEIMAACTGVEQQYDSLDHCLGFCTALDLGNTGDSGVNTVTCRREQLGSLVLAESDLHCPIAGPTGENPALGADDICGGVCEAYCDVLQVTCPTEFDQTFSDKATCEFDCDLLVDLGIYDHTIQSGDSVQCRIWHLTASTLAPTTHCGHAVGANPCD
jgi:hypothetical protein